MREILFRGKRVDNGEWIEGNYEWYHKPEKHIITNPYTRETKGVIPETVGQFTGLTDKNGKKIFEGDIIRQQTFGTIKNTKFPNEKEKKEHIKYLKKHKCIFDNETDYHTNFDNIVEFKDCRFYPFADDNFEWGTFNNDLPYEIIGNIHDNPELLKGE
ncbi:MAG: YopX family protein [Candidatus Coproplasma sp.]